MTRITVVFILLLLAFGSAIAQSPTKKDSKKPVSSDLDSRRKQLNDLLDEQWQYNLRTSPEFASILGDKRYNDKLSDASEKFNLEDVETSKKFLARFEKIDTTGFPEQEQLNKTLM